MDTCPTCKVSRLYGNETECHSCRMSQKCEACRMSMQVSNCVRYCPHCNPLRYTVTYEERIGKGKYHEGTSSPEAHKEFRYRVQQACEKGGRKLTITLWGETYYHEGERGTRQWEKIRETTVQGEFRQGTIPDLDDYKDDRKEE